RPDQGRDLRLHGEAQPRRRALRVSGPGVSRRRILLLRPRDPGRQDDGLVEPDLGEQGQVMKSTLLTSALLMVQLASVQAGERGPTRPADAVKRHDTAALRELLAARADVNAAEPDGATALHWAAYLDDLEAVQLLLRAGADPRAA